MTDAVEIPLKDKITITFKGEERTLFMSYSRLNSMLRVLGNPQNVAIMLVDADIGENIIRAAVALKGSSTSMFDVELDDEDISIEDAEAVLMWARDHVTSFFVRRLQQSGEYAKMLEPVAKALKSSLLGSADSSSSEAAAGPSE